MKTLEIITVVISVMILIISIVALGKTIYDSAYEKGFDACIQENNLYERYGE